MSKHRLERPSPVRPRLGRIAAAATSLVVTTIALLGGVGLIPLGGAGTAATRQDQVGAAQKGLTATPSTAPSADPLNQLVTGQEAATSEAEITKSTNPRALPARSGNGRRVVFSMSRQRVWLVGAKGTPLASYLVSGSLTNNLKPGSYDVYSRSRWAVGIDDSGVMQYFVRFTRGQHAPIGFHSIPKKDGQALQAEAQLGTPQSHGCIRARLADAKRLWAFAPTGTDVVVVA